MQTETIRQTGRALRSYLSDSSSALPGDHEIVRRTRRVALRMESEGSLSTIDCGTLVEYLGWYDWRCVRVVPGLEETVIAALEGRS